MSSPQTFRTILRIHKSLLLHDIPDDIMPIIFDYLGDVSETPIELTNKHCFILVCYKCPYHRALASKGHYCLLCNRILELHSKKSLYRHVNSKYHKQQLLQDPDTSVDSDAIKQAVLQRYSSYSPSLRLSIAEQEDFVAKLQLFPRSYYFSIKTN
jgi:hypothetical protein